MREQVEKRAGHRCEYCRAPQNICAYTFHVEHIVPSSKDGPDALANYALACFPCNNTKRAHVTGIDPRTGEDVQLFHPRLQKWEEHFAFTQNWSQIRGRTATGRATVERLKMNVRLQVKARPLWVKTVTWP